MSNFKDKITPVLRKFIEQQKVFFVATAAEEGTVNLSPKGMDSLRVINPNEIVWMNYTGSGNETAAHILKVNRMTIMMCSFETSPLILRMYGSARAIHERDEEFEELKKLFPETAGVRQFFRMSVEKTQTSCGWGVPLMEYKSERRGIMTWVENEGEEGIRKYWAKHNLKSIDGFDTELLEV